MVSPNKEEHRLPPAQDKAASWPSAGRVDLTLAARSQQEPGDGGFAIHRHAIINLYLNKKQCSYQESPVDRPDHLRNGGNEEEEDDDDDSCNSVKASSWPSAGCIDLTLAVRSQQQPGNGGFAIHCPAILNPYLNKKQRSYQESPIDHPDHLRNGGNKQEEDDNDDLPRIAN
jgi:hypothetical protein